MYIRYSIRDATTHIKKKKEKKEEEMRTGTKTRNREQLNIANKKSTKVIGELVHFYIQIIIGKNSSKVVKCTRN